MPAREPFITIDDAIEQAENLVVNLKKLGEYKHALSVRRGREGVIQMKTKQDKERESKQVRAGSRTYFIDVETTTEGKRYLRITESRYKGEAKAHERNSIVVFPKEAIEFTTAISEMAKKLN